MNNEWEKSPGSQVIAEHQTALRPAWLWDGNGAELIWQNDAARLFLAIEKNGKLKLASQPSPIAGQVRRLLRLGSIGLTSLSRVRFLAAGKPLSLTCSCTPILLAGGQVGLMIVGVDKIKRKLFKNLEKQHPVDGQTTKSEPPKDSDKNQGSLSRLIKQLDQGNRIYQPLTAGEDTDPDELVHANARVEKEINISTDMPEQSTPVPELWRISGSGFDRDEGVTAETTENLPLDDKSQTPVMHEQDRDVDRTARTNFIELERILEKKVGRKTSGRSDNIEKTRKDFSGNVGLTKAIALSDEMLILNRLPVGILIFRDQSILFANRALADLVGSDSISQLKSNGLAAIFPRIEDQNSSLGPVLSIMGKDGKEVAVSARLQGINWHGTQALMLSAQKKSSAQDTGEISKSFIRSVAIARNEGFIEINRNGVISNVSQQGCELLRKDKKDIIGKPFADFIDFSQHVALRKFLEQRAKTAQTVLPRAELNSRDNKLKFEIFANGSAGLVRGYFGTLKHVEQVDEKPGKKPQSQAATLLLNRLSQGIRRPLNTVLGFSELIGSEAFGTISNPRYVEYARDIETAGNEIARLTDELDEYTRLEGGDFSAGQANFDLKNLLEECMALVRTQANRNQVIVRSAIALELPNIMADRASMRQAILNLLASAIAQTPAGGKVVLSAQVEDDGSVGVHVRDSSTGPQGVDDRFVVFRERNERGGEALVAMKSTMGLALTRSLIAVNSCALHVDPSAGTGTLMSLVIPSDLVID